MGELDDLSPLALLLAYADGGTDERAQLRRRLRHGPVVADQAATAMPADLDDLSPLELEVLAYAERSDKRDERLRFVRLRVALAEQAAAATRAALGPPHRAELVALAESDIPLPERRRRRDHAPPPAPVVAQPVLRHAPPGRVAPTLPSSEVAAA